MIRSMWSTQNLTKVRKREDAKKIKVDSSIFYPATFAECDTVSKDPFRTNTNTFIQGRQYFLKDKAFRSQSILSPDLSRHDSKSLYIRKPTKGKEDSRDNNLGMAESYSKSN